MVTDDHRRESSTADELLTETTQLLGMSESEYLRKRLDSDQAWAVIESAHSGVITTLRKDGSPVSLPVWFVALGREIFVATPAHSKKVARVRRDPRCSFLVESGTRWAELLAVHLSGTATLLSDADPLRQDALQAIDQKYSSFRTATMQRQAASSGHDQRLGDIVIVRIVPEGRVLGWNNALIGLS